MRTVEDISNREYLRSRLDRMTKADPETGCINWTGYLCGGRDGRLTLPGGKKVKPYRVSYELAKGPIPEGLTIDHLCRNPACCNPDHLEPVTLRENVQRAHAARTHCQNGHALTPDNIRPGRVRACAACHRDQLAAARAAYPKKPKRPLRPLPARLSPLRTPLEVVREAVSLAHQIGIRPAARVLDIDASTIFEWKRRYDATGRLQ